LNERSSFKYLNTDGRISLKSDVILSEGVELIRMAQDSYEWQAVVNTVINLWIPQNAGSFMAR
jgi:hypothetical protein